jgi:hypothetical protein
MGKLSARTMATAKRLAFIRPLGAVEFLVDHLLRAHMG